MNLADVNSRGKRFARTLCRTTKVTNAWPVWDIYISAPFVYINSRKRVTRCTLNKTASSESSHTTQLRFATIGFDAAAATAAAWQKGNAARGRSINVCVQPDNVWKMCRHLCICFVCVLLCVDSAAKEPEYNHFYLHTNPRWSQITFEGPANWSFLSPYFLDIMFCNFIWYDKDVRREGFRNKPH